MGLSSTPTSFTVEPRNSKQYQSRPKAPVSSTQQIRLRRLSEVSMPNATWPSLASNRNQNPKAASIQQLFTRKRDDGDTNREMNLQDIRYMTQKELQILHGNGCCKPSVSAGFCSNFRQLGLQNRRDNSDRTQVHHPLKARESVVREQSATSVLDNEVYTIRKNSLWTEDTVQDLFEETVCGHKCHFWSAETYAALKHHSDEIATTDI
jgi:hypothetical protein